MFACLPGASIDTTLIKPRKARILTKAAAILRVILRWKVLNFVKSVYTGIAILYSVDIKKIFSNLVNDLSILCCAHFYHLASEWMSIKSLLCCVLFTCSLFGFFSLIKVPCFGRSNRFSNYLGITGATPNYFMTFFNLIRLSHLHPQKISK
jgi:hypothetical protein